MDRTLLSTLEKGYPFDIKDRTEYCLYRQIYKSVVPDLFSRLRSFDKQRVIDLEVVYFYKLYKYSLTNNRHPVKRLGIVKFATENSSIDESRQKLY